ncbi:MAG: LuxR family transcriptional regulator [Hyphomicrobiales bacterium]|nr:LuxR family transcriptional regulator [Hyphomicrobiales bacterium]
MPKAPLLQSYDDLARIDQAHSLEQLEDAIIDVMRGHGGEKTFAARIPLGEMRREDAYSYFILNRWHAEWRARYVENDYLLIDPIFRRTIGFFGLLRWNEVLDATSDPDGRRMMYEMAEFGLRQGVTVSLPLRGGARAAFSIAGRQMDLSPAQAEKVEFVCQFALTKALSLNASASSRKSPPKLTPRERDVLLCVSEGKTDWEISKILGVSASATDKYMRQLRLKLNAASRAHMVAQAFRAGVF